VSTAVTLNTFVFLMVNYGMVIDYTEIMHEAAFSFIKLEAVLAHVMF